MRKRGKRWWTGALAAFALLGAGCMAHERGVGGAGEEERTRCRPFHPDTYAENHPATPDEGEPGATLAGSAICLPVEEKPEEDKEPEREEVREPYRP